MRRRSTRRIGQLLIRAGKLTQRELQSALEVQRGDPTRRLAEILLDMGVVAEDELERQLRFQMEETVHELMAWEEGYFKFEERTEIALQRLLASIRVESLLMEGARRSDEWTQFEGKVPGPASIPRLAPGATARVAAGGAGAPVFAFAGDVSNLDPSRIGKALRIDALAGGRLAGTLNGRLEVDGEFWRVLLQCWHEEGRWYGQLLFNAPSGRILADPQQQFTGGSLNDLLGQALDISERVLANRVRQVASD